MWNRLKGIFQTGGKKISQGWLQGLSWLGRESISPAVLEQLEEALILADFGPKMTEHLIQHVQYCKTGSQAQALLMARVVEMMQPLEKPLHPSFAVILVGINGAGKTTTLGKLIYGWSNQGLNLHVVAADTFRAAAAAQLAAWAQNIPMTQDQGKDPASVVYRGLSEAFEAKRDVVLIDTAGRLPNHVGLMDEVKKIYHVTKKCLDGFSLPSSACQVILVLDGTNGQHALTQVKAFQEALPLSGLIVNKLDGSAKGGGLVYIAQESGLPIFALGIGEDKADLVAFKAENFAKSLIYGEALSGEEAL